MTSHFLLVVSLLGIFLLTAAPIDAKPVAATGTEVRGYRIIFASPKEFASALRMPVPRRATRSAQSRRDTSRMEKYFRLKSKLIEGRTVIMEILPEVPLMGSLFSDPQVIVIRMTLAKETEASYLYDVDIKSQYDVVSTMAVDPHPSGSLLTFTLKSTTMNAAMRAIFTQTIFAMGFLARKPELAVKD